MGMPPRSPSFVARFSAAVTATLIKPPGPQPADQVKASPKAAKPLAYPPKIPVDPRLPDAGALLTRPDSLLGFPQPSGPRNPRSQSSNSASDYNVLRLDTAVIRTARQGPSRLAGTLL
jgi:hypothetical protein